MDRRWSAGSPVDDLCRVCKTERRHTVQVVDGDGKPMRVVCDFCGSLHNYRGGGSGRAAGAGPGQGGAVTGGTGGGSGALPAVSERERSFPKMSIDDQDTGAADLEMMLRRVIREETGLTPVRPAEKWNGGELVLRPGREGVQEKTIPIETFFHKIVMVRNRLRVLEQQINATDLPDAEKVKLQGYITGAYGSLTTFNVLFADEDDRFRSR